jgi:adenosylcobinamide kinase/adenosylcobinamide-phosphate guanylyltransferase
VIINHQVVMGDRVATEAPRRYLTALARSMGYDARRTVAMMTGVPIRYAAAVRASRNGLTVGVWCTAGCSNALRVGDPGTVELGTGEVPTPGTINVIVLINQALTPSALVEAVQIATEGRVTALGLANIKSVISQETATGTGTDCIAVAAPDQPGKHVYCGKHTRLGELIGRAVSRACTKALSRRGLVNDCSRSRRTDKDIEIVKG